MCSVIRDSNGFEHLAKTYFPNTGGGAATDFFGTLSAASPFHALVLKPTAASFGTAEGQFSVLVFGNIEQTQMVAVLFAQGKLGNTSIGLGIKELLNMDIAGDSPGMWVISIHVSDEEYLQIDPNKVQLFQITDGTQILIPEVNLAELTGLESVDIVPTADDGAGIFEGCFEEEKINITSIAGCEICFRLTQEEALQYLLDQISKRLHRH